MSDPVQAQVTTITFKGAGSAGVYEQSNLGAQRVCQLEAPGFEAGRSGRSFVGGLQLITSGRIPVVDLPTTTGPVSLFNAANPAASPPRYLVVKRISFSYASGTLGAYGSTLFGGVSPSVLATPTTANGTNFSIQATRGTGASVAFLSQGTTIPTGTAWMLLGGIAHGAETTMSIGYSVDVSAHPFIVPPGFAFTFGILADTGTTAKYIHSIAWDEIEAVLP
jgi:hypothetical protein